MKRIVLEDKTVFEGKIFKVHQQKIKREDGAIYHRDIVKKNGAVAVLPITENNEIVLVSEFRDALGKEVLTVPAGLLDKENEDIKDAAKRELKEETGIHEVYSLDYVGEIYSSEGFTNESTYCFLAKVNAASRKEVSLDENEQIDPNKMQFIPFEKALQMVDQNEFKSKATNYLLLIADRMNRKK
ncbi:NUDIX hydrolase [Crassaminicella thermophila]|uniref:NUDIX hydrolase n=1 Tax=Crassaminicella thermophila TaxID=2599308 RepID=A0A5C0SAL7_CRATE|nr:NUDIX hydrolase [Crassaminicella thermophila]QEK11623.1 NUDIX hydrolase [Crassaminicella thermophila]